MLRESGGGGVVGVRRASPLCYHEEGGLYTEICENQGGEKELYHVEGKCSAATGIITVGVVGGGGRGCKISCSAMPL